MRREELPLKHIGKPKRIGRGAETEVFKFKPEKGKEYVYKEVFPWAANRYHGKSLEKKALDMKRVYDVLKKHYGDKVADTHFIVAKNKDGDPCIMKIQEKLQGPRLLELREKDPRYKKAQEQRQEMRDDLSKVALKIKKDPGLKDYSAGEGGDFINDVDASVNIIVDEKGDITAVDW